MEGSNLLGSLPAGEVDLLVVAGEASGDEHASNLIVGLRQRLPELKVTALGGPKLEEAGAEVIFNLVDHSVVGIFEVLKNLAFFRRLFRETIDWIKKVKPSTILLVDYPGFNLRLASALQQAGISRKGGGDVIVLQYVSPQLWAWKPKRRFKMQKTLDALGVIFPFEIKSYQDVNLPVSFVGHPFADESNQTEENLIRYDSKAPVALLPGSREQPVGRILPVLLASFEALLETHPELKAIIPVPNQRMGDLVRKILQGRDTLRERIKVIEGAANLSASLALMSSGTMSLRCALDGIPGVIVYKAHPLTYLLGKFLVKVPYLGMANLLLPEDPPYPEFIQGAARPEKICREADLILTNPEANRERSLVWANRLRDLLSAPQDKGAVDWLETEGSWE